MNRPELTITVDGQSSMRFPLGDGPATLTRGFGGWELGARPGRVAVTRYSGTEPLGQEIPLLLDGWRDSRSVQPQINQLIALARPVDGDPPVIRIAGPVHRTQVRWVVENIQFGAGLRLPGVGIVRQELTLQLLQYVRPDRVRLRRRVGIGPAVQLTATAQKGDTWRKLATKHFKDASKWKQLAKLNGNKPATPNKELKPGRRVRLR